MRSLVVLGALLAPLWLSGCFGDAVALEVLDWEHKDRHEMGNSAVICETGGNWVTIKIVNDGEVNIGLDRYHWQAVWDEQTDVAMRYVQGAHNAPPERSVEKVLYFCTPTKADGRPDELLLYDRAVYGGEKETGAVVVAGVEIA